MKKILWLCSYDMRRLSHKLPHPTKEAGHPSSWITNLARILSLSADIQLHIATESAAVDRTVEFELDNIIFHVTRCALPLTHRPFPSYLPLNIATLNLASVARLKAVAHSVRPDLIHAYGTEAAYAQAAVSLPYPLLLSMQGIVTEIHKVWWSPHTAITGHIERQTLKRTSHVGCRTQFDSTFVKQINPNTHIHIIHEAINPIFFSKNRTVKLNSSILFVGHVHARKGIDTLLDAMPAVLDSFPNTILNVVGTGKASYTGRLKQKCRRLNLSESVVFHGFLPPEKIKTLHDQSALLAFPSIVDNSPNAVIEAMASGLPVLASNVGGIPSVIHNGETGFLCPHNTAQDWSENLVHLLSNRAILARVADAAAAETTARNHPDIVAAETIRTYKRLIDWN